MDITKEILRINNIVKNARVIKATINEPKHITRLFNLNVYNKTHIMSSAMIHYKQTVDLIQDAIKEHGAKNVYVAYSGGKASQILAHAADEATFKSNVDLHIIYGNTSIDFPDHVLYVREYVNKYFPKADFHELRPKKDETFHDLSPLLGFPTKKDYWCCSPLKIRPQHDYIDSIGGAAIQLLGNQKSENSHRYNYLFHAEDHPYKTEIPVFNPLLNWDDLEIWAYLDFHNLPTSPLYTKTVYWIDKYRHSHQIQYTRTGCYLCPLSETHTYPHWLIVKMHYPKLWAIMEKAAKGQDATAIKETTAKYSK